MPTDDQWKPPWMATAKDKNFSDARWQAQGPKLLEPTITHCLKLVDMSYCKVDEYKIYK